MSGDKGASLRDRATLASPQAPAGLGHSESIPSAFERIVRIIPGYDRTGEPGNYGRRSMRFLFILKGELGAVQFMIGTSWGPKSSDESTRWLISRGSIDPCRPSGWDVGCHSRVPMFEGQTPTSCELTPEGQCYYDGSGLLADEWVDDFVTGGEEWLWPRLERQYHDWLAQGIEARSDETANAGSAEGESPVPNGDAPQAGQP